MIAAELRPHRQHRLDCRQGRQPERAGLFGVKGGRHRADQIARQGTRVLRHIGQLYHARGCKDGDLRPDDAGAYRFHAVKNPARPLRRPSKRLPRSSPSAPRRIARSPPARCSIFPADGRHIERSCPPSPPAANRYRPDVRGGGVLLLASTRLAKYLNRSHGHDADRVVALLRCFPAGFDHVEPANPPGDDGNAPAIPADWPLGFVACFPLR